MTATETALDQAKVEAAVERVIGDLAGTMTGAMTMLGDRLGLFRALAQGGPATSAELAERAAVNERYAREWLRGMHAAGYLALEGERFALPPEHAEVLAAESGPAFLAGGAQAVMGFMQVLEPLAEAFRSGGGVPQSAYPDYTFEGQRRLSLPWYEHLLLDVWLPAVPEVRQRLVAGARYADVGCGGGEALVRLARAFPRSSFVGYDSFEGQIELATRRAEAAGVADRVRFELRDAGEGLSERHDVISTFDVVHDAVDPLGLLRGIREALEPGGTYLLLEMNAPDDPSEASGPLPTLLYGVSILYCMTTSLAGGGAGLGTCGCPPAKVRELCAHAGFSGVERLPVESPFNVLYAARP